MVKDIKENGTEKPAAVSADKELQQYNMAYESDAAEARRIAALLAAIENKQLTDDLLEACPELAAAKKLNDKLKYRKNILEGSLKTQLEDNKKKGIKASESKKAKNDGAAAPAAAAPAKANEKNKEKVGGSAPKQAKKVNYVKVLDHGSSVLSGLLELFKNAVKKAYPDLVDVPVQITEATQAVFGDYQCNAALAIMSKLKAQGVKTAPAAVAAAIVEKLEGYDKYGVGKIQPVPAGFINIFLNTDYLEKQIWSIASNGVKLPQVEKKRVVVDFSSPNIAKEMHVGHLRSTIIGDSICNLLEAVDFDVVRTNHIGDWGTQFGMLIAHLYDKYPDFATNSPPIADLQAFYKESKKRFDDDEVFKKRAYECVVKLQNHTEPEIDQAWKLICNVSKEYNQQVYDRLNIRIYDKGESFYQDKMVSLVENIKKNNSDVLIEDEGRLVMFPEKCEIPLTVVKKDGGFTYDTSDLAALHYRLFGEKADWLIYVVDAGQSLHLETVYAAGRDFKWYDIEEKRVEHVGFGLVLGEDRKKFKTRSGETVRLLDLLNEGIKRAEDKLREKERHKVMNEEELAAARSAVAYGCIKYADLSHTRTQDYVFSFDRMLDDKGNTAVYLLYAYARIRSIVRTSGVSEADLKAYIKARDSLPFGHDAEKKLAKQIMKLSDCVLLVLDSFMIHQLCDYVYNLATVFHDFYNACYVIEKDKEGATTVHYHRLALCEVTADVMALCFKILGISEVQKM